MSRIDPFYPRFSSDAVYHDNARCQAGAEIPVPERVPGKGNNRKCPVCNRLSSPYAGRWARTLRDWPTR